MEKSLEQTGQQNVKSFIFACQHTTEEQIGFWFQEHTTEVQIGFWMNEWIRTLGHGLFWFPEMISNQELGVKVFFLLKNQANAILSQIRSQIIS